MMIGEPAAEVPDVAVVVENDRAMAAAWAAAGRLRAVGLSTEIAASGSPRKRYDRAVKKGASELLVFDVRDDRLTTRLRSSPEARAEAALADFNWPEPAAE